MPFHEICSLIKETVYPAREDLTGVGLRNNLSGENAVGNLGIGLRNKPGENNCFLNVTVQLLFHVKLFRERLLNMDDLSEHPIVHELSLLFKALIAALEQPGEILSVEALRTALGHACPKECFEKGSVHEVSLSLKLILDSVHLARVSEPHATSEPCSCTAHGIFGLDGMEWTDCPCGSVSDVLTYKSFSVSVNATSLLKSMKDRQNDSFVNHLKAVLMEDKFNCVDDGCQKKTHLTRALLASPSVYTIEIEWRPGDEDVETVMNAMLSGIDLGAIYAYLGRGTVHRPVSMVCFSGMHYVCFTLQEDVWVMFNDLKVKAIGSWVDLVSVCVADGWKPTLVFFQRPAVSPSRNTAEKHEQENGCDPGSSGTSALEIASPLTHSQPSHSQMEISPLKGGDATGSPDGDSADHSQPSHSQVQIGPPEGGQVPDGLDGEASQEQIGESETREASSSAEVVGGGN